MISAGQLLVNAEVCSLRNSPQHSAVAEAFAEESLFSLMCLGKLLPRRNCL